jgi:hypothetical protein
MAETVNTESKMAASITTRLLESKCQSFTFTPDALKVTNQPALDKYEFKIAINVNFNQGTHQATVTATVKLAENRNGEKIELAELKSTHLFLIVNFEDVIHANEQGQFVIPGPLLDLYSEVAISSARGMFSIKLEGTTFDNAVLPLIHPNLLNIQPVAKAEIQKPY